MSAGSGGSGTRLTQRGQAPTRGRPRPARITADKRPNEARPARPGLVKGRGAPGEPPPRVAGITEEHQPVERTGG